MRAIGDIEFPYRKDVISAPLRRETSALLIVDLQNGTTRSDRGLMGALRQAGHAADMDAYVSRVRTVVLPNVLRMQRTFREEQAAVVFLVVGTITGDFSDMTTQTRRAARYWEGLGIGVPYAKNGTQDIQVPDEIAPLAGEPVIVKTTNSAFTSSSLERILASRGIRELAVCGVGTNACVQITLLDAVDRGLDCVLVEDACAALTTELHEAAIATMSSFCRVESASTVIAELCK